MDVLQHGDFRPRVFHVIQIAFVLATHALL